MQKVNHVLTDGSIFNTCNYNNDHHEAKVFFKYLLSNMDLGSSFQGMMMLPVHEREERKRVFEKVTWGRKINFMFSVQLLKKGESIHFLIDGQWAYCRGFAPFS